MATQAKLPPIVFTCAACRERIVHTDMLALGTAHPDVCGARPILLRIDSDHAGRWVPIIQSHQLMTDSDRERIRKQIAEMIADHKRRA